MGARFRLWWKERKGLLLILGLIALLVMVLIFVEVRLYGTGFAGKTLWEWLQLLIIPLVLAAGGYLFTFTTSRNEHVIALDNQREVALTTYIDKISELLLHENLRESKPNAEIRDIARAITLAVLPRLDASRKGSVLKFLYETNLIKGDNCVIDLSDADLSQVNIYPELLLKLDTTLNTYNLSGVNLRYAHLQKACLPATILSGANLSGAMLHDANLAFADLSGANLQRSNMFFTELKEAKLDGAILDAAIIIGSNATQEQLNAAKSLKGATMPDGSIHP